MELSLGRNPDHHIAGLIADWAEHDARAHILVDGGLSLLWANRAAWAELKRADALSLENGRLEAAHSAARDDLKSLALHLGRGRARLFLPLTRSAGHLIVDAARHEGRSISCTALQFRRSSNALFNPEAALRPFGLTPAERSVALRLLDGATAKEVAAARGISPDTVRVQVRSIYAKLHVASRSELLRRLMPYLC